MSRKKHRSPENLELAIKKGFAQRFHSARGSPQAMSTMTAQNEYQVQSCSRRRSRWAWQMVTVNHVPSAFL